MPKLANRVTIFWTRPVSDSAASLLSVVEACVDLIPEFHCGRIGSKPAGKTLPYSKSHIVETLCKNVADGLSDDEDFQLHLDLASGKKNDIEADFRLTIFSTNYVYARSHKVHLPNHLNLYFPGSLEAAAPERFRQIVDWTLASACKLGACYGYGNLTVQYEYPRASKDSDLIMQLLKDNPTADVFEDFNDMKSFVDGVKGPMWLNILSERHLSAIGGKEALSGFQTDQLGDELTAVRLPVLMNDVADKALQEYRKLGAILDPIALDDFDPISLTFPYKFPHKGSREWINRFRKTPIFFS